LIELYLLKEKEASRFASVSRDLPSPCRIIASQIDEIIIGRLRNDFHKPTLISYRADPVAAAAAAAAAATV